tara:strand:- start:1456 stop:1665 length:210 start_codon:yes stop_codon:yes gene_type:complete
MDDLRTMELVTELQTELADVLLGGCMDALDAGKMNPRDILENLTMSAVFHLVAELRTMGVGYTTLEYAQ